MSARYFATFVSGAQDIIGNRLRRFSRAELVLEELHDGLAIFSADISENQISELRFFNNEYRLIADLAHCDTIAQAAQKASELPLSGMPQGGFKLEVRDANQPVGLESAQLQTAIATKTGGTPDSFKPAVTYLLLKRDDGRTLFGWRLPKPGYKQRRLEQGELRPELAHIIGLVAGIDHKTVVLDPFAGYGAIVREALQGFHAAEVIAVEYNEHLVPHLKSIPHLIAKQGDAARLPHIATRSIDRVVTDPPWGKYEATESHHLEHVYYGSLQQMHRVLRTKGCAVILSAAPFLPKLAAETGFAVERQYSLLVNGQKATLYKLRKLAA